MAKFGSPFGKTAISITVGVASLETASSAGNRLKLSELILGSDAATLGTSNIRWDIIRSTTTATGTAITPDPLDMADTATGAVVKSNLTAQGATGTRVVLSIPLSQQATFRWVANPGSEIVIPSSASAGVHITTPAAGTLVSAAGSLIFEEQ